MKYTFLLLILFTIFSCQNAEQTPPDIPVEYHGALKTIMRKGDLSAQADLRDFQASTHLYALGAVENLLGEILILDDQPFISSVQNQELVIDTSFAHKACLLVYAEVEQWDSLMVSAPITQLKDLENYLEQVAEEHGINTNHPFPFLLKGTAKSFDWHVINWKAGDTEHSHEKHLRSGLFGTEQNREVEILGFYSDDHHGVFTHHTSNLHLHVKTADGKIVGHVDELSLEEDVVMLLPSSD